MRLLGLIPALVLCGGLAAQTCPFTTPTFSDAAFPQNNWEFVVFSVNAGGSATAAEFADGNPAPSRSIVITINGGATESSLSIVFTFSGNRNAIWNPATQGRINSLDYCEDAKALSANSIQATSLALKQNGKIYIASPGLLFSPHQPLPEWTPVSHMGFLQSDFQEVTGRASPIYGGPPDFSVNGAPIEFGFYRGNSSAGGGYVSRSAIDNWRVRVNAQINPPLRITTDILPIALVNTIYVPQDLTVAGGTPPFEWTLVGGFLPEGMVLGSGGRISGTPTRFGTLTFVVKVTDFVGITDQKSLTLTVNPSPGGPRPANRRYSLVRDQKLEVPVVSLFSGPHGTLTTGVQIEVGPTQGSVSAGSGGFRYTPRTSFVGEDSFVYRLKDSVDRVSEPATVTISVVGGGIGSCSINPTNELTQTFSADVRDHEYSVQVFYDGAPLVGAPVIASLVGGLGIPIFASGNRTDYSGVVGLAAIFPEIRYAGAYGNSVTQGYEQGEAGPSFQCSGLVSVQDYQAFSVIELCKSIFDPLRPAAPQVAGANPGGLNMFREFRDKVLTPNARGSEYADLYYRFRPELLQIMLGNPSLLWKTRTAVEQHNSVVRALLRGEKVSVSATDAKQVDGLLQSLEERAGPELRRALAGIRRDIGDQNLVASFGLKVDPTQPPQTQTELRRAFEKLPLHFEAVQDRKDPNLRYQARGPGYNVRLNSDNAGLTIHLGSSRDRGIGMQLVGASRTPRIVPESPLAGSAHYLLGRSPKEWRTVRRYARVRYRQVYSGIDLVYYGNQQQLEYDLIVAPGSTPDRIRFAFSNVDRVETNAAGDLKLIQKAGDLHLRRPVAYQEIGGARSKVDAGYVVLAQNQIAFRIGDYDKSQPLVIDPVLSYASLAGGSGMDYGMSIAVDEAGNAYVTGATTSANLSTMNPFQQRFRDGGQFHADGFVTKFDPTGSTILYSTYFGGSDDDVGVGIAVDAQGNAYVTGATRSADFPTVQPIQAAFGGAGHYFKTDAFVLKLDPTGSKLLYSTYLGGSGDDGARSIVIDSTGNAYVGGITSSSNFPIRGGVQSTNRGGKVFRSDGFVAKINAAGNALVYSTYVGGTGDDAVIGLAVDAAGSAYLAGFTYSTDFPLMTPFQSTLGGTTDVFVAKLNPAGSALLYSTYLGGASDDYGSAVAVDAQGNAYVTGYTGSATDFPRANAAQPKFGSGDGLGFDAFVTKLNPAGSALVYSTFLGGSGRDHAYGVVVDAQGNAYIAGETDSPDFASPGAVQGSIGGKLDGFLAKISANGLTFDYRTYLGGAQDDGATSLALDRSGNVYLTGVSVSGDAPATIGAFQTNLQGLMDAVIIKIGPGNAPPGFASVSAASYAGSSGLAAQSIASGFGAGFTTLVTSATGDTLPTTLDGLTVTVKDASGAERLAPLFLTAPNQINYLVPAGTAPGLAAIAVKRGSQTLSTGVARINRVAPAIFSANADGRGVAAAFALHVAADGTRSQELLYECGSTAGSCVGKPIDLGPAGDQVFLLLFGTGIRNLTTPATAKVGGVVVPVLGAVPQGQFPGLDQVNIGPLPRTLAGKGLVDIELMIDTVQANSVRVNIR